MTSRRHVTTVMLALALAAAASSPASGQIDHYFGQNKIAYDKFRWKVYKAPHFDVYYYPESEPFLDDIVSYAESAYVRLSQQLDHELRFRIPMIIYKTHGEFEETNITLEEVPEAVGAFAEPIQNRMVLPIDQPPDKLYELIAHELTHIFQYSLFFEGYLGRALRARIPTWLVEGMASYYGQDEESLDRMVIRDAVVNNYIPPIQQLDQLSYLNYRFGHAIFDFIEQEYGKEGVHNFVYEYRKVLLTGNIEKAVKEAFGVDIEAFNRNFNRFLRKRYLPVLMEKKSPDDYGREIGINTPGVFTFSPTLSPSGELVAALASPKMDLDLVVLSAEDGTKVKNLTKGWSNKYRYLVAEAFSGRRDLSWSPTGDQIAVFVRKENTRRLAIYDSLHGKLERIITLPGIAQGASPAFSPDGKRVAFEGNRNGVVDIFEIDLQTKSIRNLTDDDDYDANPWYAADGTSLIYNRRIGSTWKIFSVDLTDPTRKTQLTFGASTDIQPSYSRDGKTVFFSSDRGGYGVFNIFALDLASGETRQYTDVVGGCFAPVEMAPRDGEAYLVVTAYFDGTFRLYRMPLRQAESSAAAETMVPGSAEAEPFEPPLKLKADVATAKRYKTKWDLEAPSISVGVTDDGTFLSNVVLQFADLLGDHRIGLQYYSVSDFSNFVVAYSNLKHRTRWGATLFDLRDYYLSSDGFGLDREQTQRSTGVEFSVQYPFNRYYRIDGSITAIDGSQDLFLGYDLTGVPQFQTAHDRFLVRRTLDRGRYHAIPIVRAVPGEAIRVRGELRAAPERRFPRERPRVPPGLPRVQAAHPPLADRVPSARRLERRRPSDLLRDRRDSTRFGATTSGRSTARTSPAANVELRFPFVDELLFPIGPIRNIRGFVFLDLGTASLPDGSFYDPDALRRAAVDPVRLVGQPERSTPGLAGLLRRGIPVLFPGRAAVQLGVGEALVLHALRGRSLDPSVFDLIPVKADGGGTRSEFYITFDW